MSTTANKEDQTKGTGGKVIIPASQRNDESALSSASGSHTEEESVSTSGGVHNPSTHG